MRKPCTSNHKIEMSRKQAHYKNKIHYKCNSINIAKIKSKEESHLTF